MQSLFVSIREHHPEVLYTLGINFFPSPLPQFSQNKNKIEIKCFNHECNIAYLHMIIQYIGPNAKPLKELIKQTYQTTENCLRTNYYGTKQVSKELIPLLQLSNSARIVNVSSGMGQLKVNYY